MSDMIKDIQRLAAELRTNKGSAMAIEDIINRLDTIARKGTEQRRLCAKAFEQCGLYANIENMSAESKQINTCDIDHTVNDKHDSEIRNF